MKKLFSTLLLLCLLSAVNAQSYDYSKIAAHPRLLLQKSDEARLKESIKENRSLQLVDDYIMEYANETLTAPTVERIKEGKRLLAVSRTALKRIFYLSYAYRLYGDEKYARRATDEMLKVSNFKDWNPTHFLDVGEMAMAVAIGYDWLYDYLSDGEKSTIRNAMIEKGFDAAKDSKNAWFYGSEINWNSVCNAGLLYGALAIFDEAEQLSIPIIEKCLESNPKAMSSFAPDGAYPEGYNYWGYGTTFQVLLIAALDSALGDDNGLSDAPGFANTAKFMQIMGAPSYNNFSFYDTNCDVKINPAMFWFASKREDASLLYLEKQYIESQKVGFAEDRILPILSIFASHVDLNVAETPKENFWVSSGITPLFIYRGGWANSDDAYLGVKGGSASASHAHCDSGSFVYEKDGVRWATDLGMQSYISLESVGVDLWGKGQDSQRWEIFRLSNEAHNTLFVNNQTQIVKAFADITKCFKTEKRKGAVVDLTAPYANSLKKAIRTIYLDQKDNLTVEDALVGGTERAEVEWIMCTPTDAKIISKTEIELTKDGKKMILSVDCKEPVELRILSNEPKHSYDHPNPGTRRVAVAVNVPANSKCTLKVSLRSNN